MTNSHTFKPTLITPYTSQALSALKIAALYADKIRVPRLRMYEISGSEPLAAGSCGTVEGVIELLDEEILEALKPLLAEDMVEFVDEDHFEIGAKTTILTDTWSDSGVVPTFLRKNIGLLFREECIVRDEDGRKTRANIRFGDEEVRQVHLKYKGPLEVGAVIDFGFLFKFYADLLRRASDAMASGDAVFSASPVLRNSFAYGHSGVFRKGSSKQPLEGVARAQVITDVLEVALLNLAEFPLNDILEVRLALSTELEAFRKTMQEIQFDLIHEFGARKLLREGREIVEHRIKPRIDDLEQAVLGARKGILRAVRKVAQKPTAYVPLLGSSFLGLPPAMALALSGGMVTVEAVSEWRRQYATERRNGLFYLVKLRSAAGAASR